MEYVERLNSKYTVLRAANGSAMKVWSRGDAVVSCFEWPYELACRRRKIVNGRFIVPLPKKIIHLIPNKENTLFCCLHVNWPLLSHLKPNIPLNSADGIEATRANYQ